MKVLIPLKGVLKRVPVLCGGWNRLDETGAAPFFFRFRREEATLPNHSRAIIILLYQSTDEVDNQRPATL